MNKIQLPLLAPLTLVAMLSQVNAATFDLKTATLADINAAMDAGALTSERLIELSLKRIEEAYDECPASVPALPGEHFEY
jgi:hypothetical protein